MLGDFYSTKPQPGLHTAGHEPSQFLVLRVSQNISKFLQMFKISLCQPVKWYIERKNSAPAFFLVFQNIIKTSDQENFYLKRHNKSTHFVFFPKTELVSWTNNETYSHLIGNLWRHFNKIPRTTEMIHETTVRLQHNLRDISNCKENNNIWAHNGYK